MESLSFNNCLNAKISIDRFGNIKNCPSMAKSANSTSKCKITKCFCKSTPLVLRNSISFLVSH